MAFYQNSFVISPGCYISWLDATLDDLQMRPLRQILLFFQNNSLTVWNLQTGLCLAHLSNSGKFSMYRDYNIMEINMLM